MERVAEGKLQINTQRHELGRLIRETIESFAMRASAKTVLLRALPSEIHGELECDRDRIVQVLSNLIANALKFTVEGGTVTV
ncbi:hypothetical protein ACI3PL_21435, partial [Lacticaseibacillus paracasei]